MHDVKASDVMNENFPKVSKDDSIGSVRDFMENKGLRAVVVVDGDNLEGAISYRDLVRHTQYNESTNLSKVIHMPPEFNKEDSLVELADLRVESGKKLMVYTEGGSNLKAVVSDEEFVEACTMVKEFENYSTRNLASHELIEVFEDDPIDKARNLMLDNNISRLPVLDSEGELTGILRSTDLLKMLVPRESPDKGGTSGRSLEDTQISGGVEKESMSDITVGEIHNPNLLTVNGFGDSIKAAEKMIENNSTDLIISDSGYPKAILTVKDYVDYLEDHSYQDMVLVNLVGLEVEEEKAAVHQKIATQLRGSLGRKMKRPEELSIHVKKHDKDGKRHRYELIAKLHSEYGMITTTVEAWDLLEAVDKALDELNTLVRKKKEKSSQ